MQEGNIVKNAVCVDYDTIRDDDSRRTNSSCIHTAQKKIMKSKKFNINALKRKLCNIFSLKMLIFYVNIYASAERYRFASRRNI